MNTEQLVEDLRYHDCYLNFFVTGSPDIPTSYVARFWYNGASIDGPWADAATFDEAIRVAAITVITQRKLGVIVPGPKWVSGWRGSLQFIFWVIAIHNQLSDVPT